MEDQAHRVNNDIVNRQLSISDFCDMKKLDQLIHDWSNSTGLAAAMNDPDGNRLCENYKFTEFCRVFNHGSAIADQRCMACERDGTGIFQCHAGLCIFAFEITLNDGTYLGKVFGGQVLTGEMDEAVFRAYAKEIGVDPNAYVGAAKKVGYRTKEQVESSVLVLSTLVRLFVRSSYDSYIDAKFLSEREKIISSLSKIYFCDYYIDLVNDSFVEIDANEEMRQMLEGCTSASETMKKCCITASDKEYQKGLLKFNQTETLASRLREKKNISYEFISAKGNWIRAVYIPVVYDEDGSVTHVLYALQYIQEEKMKEIKNREKLKKAADAAIEANQAKTDFLSRMSHDIRTPLNGIIGMTHIAMEQNNPEKTLDCLKKIDVSSAYLLGLINDVLNMAKIESGNIHLHPEPYPFDEFKDYFDSVLRLQADAKQQTLIMQCETDPDRIPMVDKLRMNQVIFNLVSNAIKYAPEYGTISYTSTEVREDDKLMLKIVVKDNGRGMSEQFQKILFEPYTQEDRVRSMSANNGSSGLGLAIVHKIVVLMNGTITVSSELNKGSTFTVCIPMPYGDRRSYEEQDACHREKVNMEKMQGRHILICEDNDINLEIAENVLKKAGMNVETAKDGKEGLEMFKKSVPGHFDAVLMDLRMPVMNGYEAAKAIRHLKRADALTVPIIAMTADAFDEDIQHCLQAGMNEHLAKPLQIRQLYQVLERCMHS